MENLPMLWIVLGIVLIIAEIFTMGFVIFWFGVGAFAAALTGYLGMSIVGQFFVFALVSAGLTVMSRTIFSRYLGHSEAESLKSGIEALPGKVGTVVDSSHGALEEGSVKVFGSVWTAFPASGERPLAAGEKVEVVSVEGSSIYVKKLVQPEETKGDWH